jgi:hypothetical protein
MFNFLSGTVWATAAYNAACKPETIQDVDNSKVLLWCSYLEGESETHKSHGI